MHPLFDHRMTDPTGAAVRDALRRACAAVNGRRKSGTVNVSQQGTKTLAARVLREPEGVYSHTGNYSATGTAGLALAWWTAPGERKLVRVRAWRQPWRGWDASPERAAESRDHGTRPAVWHLDPERVTRVEAEGHSQWVAVCGCGAVGTPESLAWAGGMCGPCRDRVEEHGERSVSHAPALLTDAEFTPARALFTPDGAHVVAAGGNTYRVWDRAGTLVASGRRTPGLPLDTISPDGRHVLVGGPHGALSLDDVTTGKRYTAVEYGAAILGSHWTGRPGELLVQYWVGDYSLVLHTIDGGETRVSEPIAPPLIRAKLHFIRPDAAHPRAVFVENGNVVVSRVGRGGELRTEHQFRLGTGQHDRTGGWTQGPEFVRFTPDGERMLFVYQNQLELWHLSRRRCLIQGQLPGRVADLAFAPDYEHLFLLEADGAVSVCHPGLLTHVRPRARLRWHVGAARSLAVSPDGKTLATAGAEGVKLWPVARLLEVV
jgi:WD40 repeat protein